MKSYLMKISVMMNKMMTKKYFKCLIYNMKVEELENKYGLEEARKRIYSVF